MAEAFEVRAVARHIQISTQKVRLVVDMVRGKGADEAMNALRFLPNKAAEPVYKLIQSAIANAEQNYGLEIDELFVSRIFADEGPRRKLSPYGGRFGGVQSESHCGASSGKYYPCAESGRQVFYKGTFRTG